YGLLNEGVVPLPGNASDDLTQERIPGIAVFIPYPRGIGEREAITDKLSKSPVAHVQLPVAPRIALRESGSMCKQVPDGYAGRIGFRQLRLAELGNISHQRVIQLQTAGIPEL